MLIHETVGRYRLDIELGGNVAFDVQLSNSRHKHDYYELCLVLSGSGEYVHGDQRLAVAGGDVFVADPRVLHEISSVETRDLRIYFVSMAVTAVELSREERQRSAAEEFLASHCVVSNGFGRLAAYVPLLEAHSRAEPELLRLFALEMMDACRTDSVPPDEAIQPDEAAEALRFIDRNLHRTIRAADVANHLGISERTLRRRFQSWSGTRLSEEINHRRMRWAAHRLLMGFNVAEVSEMVGISEQAQFTRAFTRSLGMSPKRFQRTYMPGSVAHRTRA